MPLSATAKDVLASTVSSWFQSFGGTSALDVARALSLDHDLVMRTFEALVATNHGSMNQNVVLCQVSFDPEDIAAGFNYEPVVTHIFFPSKQALREAFYSSDLAQRGLPEYATRLHLGASQIGLAYFDEELLARYLDHPELYEINDSLAGGNISSLSSTPEDRYLYVRYGKCRLKSRNIAVTAICKDLSDMGKSEQRYWHAHELVAPALDKSDSHFQNFLARTYEGEFVDFEDPISRLRDAIVAANRAMEPNTLFDKLDNVHLRLPVEQTYKSYCDAASELYKIVGPDNVSQTALKKLLTDDFALPPESLKHAESQRPLSTIQLLEVIEKHLESPALLTGRIRALAQLRVAADHKVLEPDPATRSYSRDFAGLCTELSDALEQLVRLLEERAK